MGTLEQIRQLQQQIATLRQEVKSIDVDRLGHLRNVLENMLLEMRAIRELPQQPHRDMVSALAALGSAWPPFRATQVEDPQRRWIACGVSEAIARIVEAESGTPCGAAATTRPLVGSLARADGPVVIACATLDRGGAERQAALTAAGLARRGQRVVFVGHTADRDLSAQAWSGLLDGSSVELVNAAASTVERRMADDDAGAGERLRELGCGPEPAAFLRGHLQVFRALRPSVVHAWLDYTNVMAGLAALWAGVPKVVLGLRYINPTNTPFYQPFFRPLYRLMASDPRVDFIANSQAGAVDYAQWLGIDPTRIAVVRNAVVPASAEQRGSEARLGSGTGPRILGVMNLRPEKDPALFVRVCQSIAEREPSASFTLVGAGTMEHEVRALVAALGLEGRLQMLGRRDDVLILMRSADVMLHVSLAEGLPNVFLEAQSVGLPIVSVAGGGAAEALQPGLTGRVVHDRCPAALADAVLSCLHDPAWMTRAREAGPKFVEATFGIDAMLDATVAVYGRTLQGTTS